MWLRLLWPSRPPLIPSPEFGSCCLVGRRGARAGGIGCRKGVRYGVRRARGPLCHNAAGSPAHLGTAIIVHDTRFALNVAVDGAVRATIGARRCNQPDPSITRAAARPLIAVRPQTVGTRDQRRTRGNPATDATRRGTRQTPGGLGSRAEIVAGARAVPPDVVGGVETKAFDPLACLAEA